MRLLTVLFGVVVIGNVFRPVHSWFHGLAGWDFKARRRNVTTPENGSVPSDDEPAASCPPPPSILRTRIVSSNGTGWSAITEYRCEAGYQLYPSQQRTTSVCRYGLWSLRRLSCLTESEVLMLKLGELGKRLDALSIRQNTLQNRQLKMMRQPDQIARRLQRVEQRLDIISKKFEAEEMKQEKRKDEKGREDIGLGTTGAAGNITPSLLKMWGLAVVTGPLTLLTFRCVL